MPCECPDNKCSQLSCECFSKGITCDDSCVCIGCQNTKIDAASTATKKKKKKSSTMSDFATLPDGGDYDEGVIKCVPASNKGTSFANIGKKVTAEAKKARADGCSCKNSK